MIITSEKIGWRRLAVGAVFGIAIVTGITLLALESYAQSNPKPPAAPVLSSPILPSAEAATGVSGASAATRNSTAAAATTGPGASPAADGHGVPGAVSPLSSFKPLEELPGVLSWKQLSQVQQVRDKDKVTPQFPAALESLNRKEVKIQGFMMPLEAGDKQRHFILVSWPPTCSFCLPGGAESIVEVRTK